MIQQKVYTFKGQLIASEGIGGRYLIEDIILCSIPGAVKVKRANLIEDMNGIDYWVTLESGSLVKVDAKVRDDDWLAHHPDEDDIALETYSKVKRNAQGIIIGGTEGWTRNPKKQTDWVDFIWKETGRYFYLPFPWLRRIFNNNWEQWRRIYKTSSQFTKNPDGSEWESECVFVPRRLLGNMVCKSFAGTYPPQEETA